MQKDNYLGDIRDPQHKNDLSSGLTNADVNTWLVNPLGSEFLKFDVMI